MSFPVFTMRGGWSKETVHGGQDALVFGAESVAMVSTAGQQELVASRGSRGTWTCVAFFLVAALAEEVSLWRRFEMSQPGPHGDLAQTDFTGWFATARMLATGRGARIFDQQANLAMQATINSPHQGYLLNNY